MADKPQPEQKQTNENADPLKEQAIALFKAKYPNAQIVTVELKQSGKTEVLYWINGVAIKVKKA